MTTAGRDDPLFAELAFTPAVHWNNDVVVTPPRDAVILAEVGRQLQAFRIGSSVYGVQFHPEVDAPTVTDWAREDLEAGRADEGETRARLTEIATADRTLMAHWGDFTRRFADRLQR